MNILHVLALALVLVAAVHGQCPHAARAGEGRTYKMVTTTTIMPVTGKAHQGKLLNSGEVSLIRSTLKQLKKSGEVAPKIFLRYLQTRPEAQRMLPGLETVPLRELSRNPAFLSIAYNCYAAMHYYLQHSENVDPSTCTYMSKAAQKYSIADVRELNSVLLSVFEDELGSHFTLEAKLAIKKALDALVHTFAKSN